MKPMLMGQEVEYAVSGWRGGRRLASETIHQALEARLKAACPWLPDRHAPCSIYLANGSRFYLDAGGHPELASAEVSSPREIVHCDLAGERLLREAARDAERETGIRITVLKNNLGPAAPDSVTYGCHEAYTSWRRPSDVVHSLLPHLVTRTLYAGAGSLSARDGSPGFELSQRARHIVNLVGGETTCERALFSTRERKPSDVSPAGWRRAHLITKDAHRAPLGTYLTFGTTGLLFAALSAGYPVGGGLALHDSVAALQEVSCDPWLERKLCLADGRRLSAVEIQWRLLEDADRFVQTGAAPDWAPELLDRWRQTLECFADGPTSLHRHLDASAKLMFFSRLLAREGLSWAAFVVALRKWRRLQKTRLTRVTAAVLEEREPQDPKLAAEFQAALADLRAAPSTPLDQIRLAARLDALDLKYHELGGLYDGLLADGHIDASWIDPQAVAAAVERPPGNGRAAARGELIRQRNGSPEWTCDWQGLYQASTKTILDLSDPFASHAAG